MYFKKAIVASLSEIYISSLSSAESVHYCSYPEVFVEPVVTQSVIIRRSDSSLDVIRVISAEITIYQSLCHQKSIRGFHADELSAENIAWL